MENNQHKILVVDDNVKNIQVLANLLSENNYNVEFALNGGDALKLLVTEELDLILLDIMMPEMDGFEVCKKIRENEYYNNIPIIFLTAKTDIDSIKNAFKFGGVDYVSKPFNSDELLSRVSTHLELKRNKDKLKNANKWLVEKVQERTAELEIANKQLIGLDKAKTQFIKIISHEIRTPLNGILGGLTLLKNSELSEEASSLIEILNQSSLRLENFSNKAIDISKLSTLGGKSIKKDKIKIEDFFNDLLNHFEEAITKKKINIFKTVKTELDFIEADQGYLYKCMYSIIHNAIKHSPNNGLIAILIRNERDHLIIECKDQGTGFKKELSINDIAAFGTKDHIDDNPGLSLFLSNLIVRVHGGFMEIGNNKDLGAFVKLTLPVTFYADYE